MEKIISVKSVIDELNKNKNVFKILLSNLSKEVCVWRSEPQKWCLLEILCHLYDEEREDFRARVKYILENPGQSLPSLDPDSWVQTRKYIEKDYETVLSEFVEEREISVKWLSRLADPSWNNISHNPQLGDISANRIFINWLAHDYLHIRQIIKLKYDYLKNGSDEDLSYAGNW
jgi:hypothetical protein